VVADLRAAGKRVVDRRVASRVVARRAGSKVTRVAHKVRAAIKSGSRSGVGRSMARPIPMHSLVRLCSFGTADIQSQPVHFRSTGSLAYGAITLLQV
jgi:hypothetical protein